MVGTRRPGLFRRAAHRVLTHPWVLERAASRSAGYAAIFMLHRFSEPGASGAAFPTDILRSHLQWLRAHQYRLTGLDTLTAELSEGRPIPARTVVFTVDDGYDDFNELASPIFAEFDCPVTIFVVTDFLDGKCWLWWDQIEYAILHTNHTSCQLPVRGAVIACQWATPTERRAAISALIEVVKYLPADARNAIILQLLASLEVQLPPLPTPEYAPMSWERLRRVASPVVRVGPHTLTHPILAMEDAVTSEAEILGSWARLTAEVPSALPIFCYPNGDGRAFGTRELDAVARNGLVASVSTSPGYVAATDYASAAGPLRQPLPRLSLETGFARMAQVASGLDRLKGILRHTRRGAPPR